MIDAGRARLHTFRVGTKKKAKATWNARGIDWGAVDWGRPNTEIAAELKCSLSSVQKARGRLGIEQGPVGRPSTGHPARPVRLDWEGVAEAAEQDGVSSAEFVRGLVDRELVRRKLRSADL